MPKCLAAKPRSVSRQQLLIGRSEQYLSLDLGFRNFSITAGQQVAMAKPNKATGAVRDQDQVDGNEDG